MLTTTQSSYPAEEICTDPALRPAEQQRGELQNLQSDLKIKMPEVKPKPLLKKCRCCKAGNLVTIAVFGQRGPPSEYLFVIQPMSAK